MEKNYIIHKNGCTCHLCKGTDLPPCPNNWDRFSCGGRHPFIIDYNPDKIGFVWISANGNPDFYIDDNSFITELPASVHGCWKVKKNQTVIVYKK